METPEEIERQIWAQVNKFNEVSRQLKIYEKSEAYKAWEKSTKQTSEVPLILWPNTPKSEKFIQCLEKACGPPEWTCSTEKEFLKRRGLYNKK